MPWARRGTDAREEVAKGESCYGWVRWGEVAMHGLRRVILIGGEFC